MKKRRINLFSLFFDLLIDFALIGLGVALYYQFFVYRIFPVTISPALTDPVGGFENAAYILCGIPFVVGMLSLLRTIVRTVRKLFAH
jgi:hypothetical protein